MPDFNNKRFQGNMYDKLFKENMQQNLPEIMKVVQQDATLADIAKGTGLSVEEVEAL